MLVLISLIDLCVLGREEGWRGLGGRVYDLDFLYVEVNQVHLLFNLRAPPPLPPRARRKDRSLFVVTVKGGISKRKKKLRCFQEN